MSDAADEWLAGLLGDEAGVALVAVGGYGRQCLAPYSDLDVVLVHRGRRDVKAVAERVWYPVWDAGVGLDHSVRTTKEALAVAADDLKAAMGLLEARFVAGDAAVARELIVRAAEQWRGRFAKSLAALRDSVVERHSQFGEVAFLLEPELKEGRGGLRDLAALRAAGSVVGNGLAAAEELLLTVRVELHRRVGRASDRLALQEQDAVAAACGFADADALMAAVAGAARTIAWECDDMLRRLSSRVSGRRPPAVAAVAGPGLLAVGDEVVLAEGADVRADPSLPWRAAAVAVKHGLVLGRPLLEALGSAAPAVPEGSPWPEEMRSALLTVLGGGEAAVGVFEALDQQGLVHRSLPEWEAVRSRPQRNAYHRFTVDRHLVETAANAAAFVREVSRPDLLLLGALLHDIGKGWPERDHTDVGIELVGSIAARLGYGAEDAAVLQAMVRHHLLLPDVATRRDLEDPATVEFVAAAVDGNAELLELLAALTVADSEATGPGAWGTWKAGLVADLVDRVRRRLAGHHPAEPVTALLDRFSAEVAARSVSVVVSGSEIGVVAPDRAGLFSRVAGTLALHGLDVREAQAASSDDGMAVELFVVASSTGREVNWERVRADIGLAVRGRLSVEARLADRIRDYSSLPRRPSAAREAEARVLFDNAASDVSTVVEVRAPDAIGVLYRITRALADCDLNVATAKVSTLGHEVVDSFYVRDSAGAKIEDAAFLAEIERAVLAELARVRQ